MDIIQQISKFLDAPDSFSFAYGLELYKKAGPGPSWEELKKFKYSRPPVEARNILIEELMILVKVLNEVGTPEPGAGTVSEIQPAPVRSEEPEKTIRLREEQKWLLKQRDKVHAELCLIAQQPESNERQNELYKRASELMSQIIPRLDHIYHTLETFEKSGEIPFDEKVTGIKLSKKLNSKRSSLSRFKKLRRENKDCLKDQYYEQKIWTIKNEIEGLEEEILKL